MNNTVHPVVWEGYARYTPVVWEGYAVIHPWYMPGYPRWPYYPDYTGYPSILPGTPRTYTSPASARVPSEGGTGVQQRSPGLKEGGLPWVKGEEEPPGPKGVREERRLCAELLPLSLKNG